MEWFFIKWIINPLCRGTAQIDLLVGKNLSFFRLSRRFYFQELKENVKRAINAGFYYAVGASQIS